MERHVCPFRSKSSYWITGCTGAGKTSFVYNLLKEKDQLFEPSPPEAVLYCYSVYQPLFDEMESMTPNFEIHKGVPSMDKLDEFTADRNHKVIVIDDLMLDVINNSDICKLFTDGCSHRGLSVFFLTHNLFPQGKCARTMSLNTSYIVLFQNMRDALQIGTLSRQIFPTKPAHLIDAYNDSTARDHGYLIVDLLPNVNDKYRLRTCVFSHELPTVVYLP